MEDTSGTQEEFLFKVLVIGDVGVGKTSIIKRYVHNFFSQHYKSTIGVDFALKTIEWDDRTTVRLQLWDIGGQERFGNMTRVYYREAAGAVVVYDCTRATTFEGALRWKDDLDQKVRLADGTAIPTVLLGNKGDLLMADSSSSTASVEKAVEMKGFLSAFLTSAKENFGIDDAATALVQQMIEVRRSGQYELPMLQKDGDVWRLNEDSNSLSDNGRTKASSMHKRSHPTCCR